MLKDGLTLLLCLMCGDDTPDPFSAGHVAGIVSPLPGLGCVELPTHSGLSPLVTSSQVAAR